MIKEYKRSQGIVANANLEVSVGRQLFMQTDPTMLEAITADEGQNFFSGGDFFEFDPEPLLQYLPEQEAEIVYLLYICGKNQQDVGNILGLTQPTISSKYHRALLKIRYLSLIRSVDLQRLLSDLPNIDGCELEILFDLFYTANQEYTAKKLFIAQSRVRYVFKKFFEVVLELEKSEPMKYANIVGIFYFLRRFMRLRIHTSKGSHGSISTKRNSRSTS